MKKIYPSKIIIGIDPGVNTGYALFEAHREDFTLQMKVCIGTSILDALERLKMANLEHDIFVLVEDARQRKWFGVAESNIYRKIKSRQPINSSELSTYKGMLLGAGSVQRDCSILESFLQASKIPHVMVSPAKSRTKVSAAGLKAAIGWTERTNEHGRDAAMLVLTNYKKAFV
jgi:hypothetical protein